MLSGNFDDLAQLVCARIAIAMPKITALILKTKFDALQSAGLSAVIRARAENAVIYRKWGNLGEWGPARASVQKQLRDYQPEYLTDIIQIFNEA